MKLWKNALLLAFCLVFLFGAAERVLSADAYVAYRSASGSGVNFPKLRLWNSTSNTYGSQVELPTSGSPLRQVVLKTSPLSSKLAIVTSSDDGGLDGYVCVFNCTNPSSWTVSNNFAQSIATSAQRRYDMAFESATEELVIVYALTSADTSRDIAYRLLAGGSNNLSDTTELYINDAGAAGDVTYSWVAMDRNPEANSTELAAIGFDLTSTDITAWIWNGTEWADEIAISDTATATNNNEALAIRYNSDGTGAIATGGFSTNGAINWAFWNGTGWSAVSSFDVDAGDANDVRWISLKPNPLTLDFQAVAVDSGSDLTSAFYNDSASSWIVTSNVDAGLDIATTRPADFAWLPNGTAGIIVWDTDGAGTTLSQRLCSPLCTAATSTFSSYAGTGGWITLFRNINDAALAKVLGVRLNSSFSMGSFYFNETNYTNYGDSAIASADSINTFEFYSLDYSDSIIPGITISFIQPTDANGIVVNRSWSYVSVNVSPGDASCDLNWSGSMYPMSGPGSQRGYNVTGLPSGNVSTS